MHSLFHALYSPLELVGVATVAYLSPSILFSILGVTAVILTNRYLRHHTIPIPKDEPCKSLSTPKAE